MDMGLEGRVAIVTGARRGIGRAECHALGREGARVVAADIVLGEELDSLIADIEGMGGSAIALKVDVSAPSDVSAMVDRSIATFGRVDILVNNAALTGAEYAGPERMIPHLAESEWRSMLDVNLTGSFLCMKYTVPHMINRGWGRIINTSSIVGQVGGAMGDAHYAASKAGIIGLTKSAAKELGQYGITVIAVAPGYVDTETLRESMTEETASLARSQVPVGRFGRPEELGALVAFLASEQSAYLSGAVIDFNGGGGRS